MTLFLGMTLKDATPATAGVVPIVQTDGSVVGLPMTAAGVAFSAGGGVDVIAEKTAAAGVTVDGVLCKDGGVTLSGGQLLVSRAATTGAIAMGFGATAAEGWMISTVEETVSFVGNAAPSIALYGGVIAATSVILAVQANIAAALTGGGTTVKLGIGIDSDPDKYGLSAALTKNLKINTTPAHAVIASPETLKLYACASNGAAGDTALTVGSVRVRLVYATLVSLADAP